MSGWSENLAEYTLEDVAALTNENRARHKEIRLRTGALVNSKLAKQIGSDEYAQGAK